MRTASLGESNDLDRPIRFRNEFAALPARPLSRHVSQTRHTESHISPTFYPINSVFDDRRMKSGRGVPSIVDQEGFSVNEGTCGISNPSELSP